MGEIPLKARRKFPRVQKHWFVHYMRAESTGTNWNVASVMDLSAGGVRFRTEERLEAETQLSMKFNLPIPALRLVKGKIVWCKELGPKRYEYGVEFERLKLGDTGLIKSLVSRLMQRER